MHEFSAQPIDHPACLSDADLLAQCERRTNRSSGPGGQHRNKVESQIILLHTPTGVMGQAAERRSAHENQRVALRRLRLALAVEVRGPVHAGEVGSPLWRSRLKKPPRPKIEEIMPGVRVKVPVSPTGGGRISCSPDHADYPCLLAEAMDVIAASAWDVKRAAVRLTVSPTQLVRFIKDHPPALARVNAERLARGEHTLK